MFLSSLRLVARDRRVIRDLADCQRLHRLVMEGFPDIDGPARAELGVLFRLEGNGRGRPHLLVQSGVEPDWTPIEGHLSEPPRVKSLNGLLESLVEDRRLVFRLRANPTKRAGKSDETHSGKRVDLRGEKERLEWLRRRGRNGGFDLVGFDFDPAVPRVRVNPEPPLHGRKRGGRLTFGSALFEGLLRITDAEAFRRTVKRGLGSAKAYGFGLLSLAAPR